MTGFDVLPYLGEIAARPRPQAGIPPLEAALTLNNGRPLMVFPLDEVGDTLDLPGIVPVNDPDLANVTLIVHGADPAATAVKVETAFEYGQRVALWDAAGDLALIEGLLASTVYVGNLAAIDTDLARGLAVVLTPLRNGAAFRRCTAASILTQWVWEKAVRTEVERLYGMQIAEADMPRALMQTRTRMGAWLARLRQRGVRCALESVRFEGGRTDALRLKLTG
jgi:hypothetical protein